MPDKKTISVLLTGGGTGGHIYPAIAVARELKNDPQINALYYIGCSKNIEKEIIARENIDFYPVNVSGMPRKVGMGFFMWVFELSGAILKSLYYLLKLKPDAVFGTGGYVTAPVLAASLVLGVPYVIHDPDAHPGMVSRFFSGSAGCVSTAFEQAKKYLKSANIKVFGNPTRAGLNSPGREDALKALDLSPERTTILAIGGSQGARTINNAIKDAVPELIGSGFQVIHQTGARNYEGYMRDFSGQYRGYIVKPYFDDMSIPLNAADIAVSRAGSLSLSELNLCGLPSILVPYPYAAADHQRFNARAMQEAGAGLYVEDAEFNAGVLIKLIRLIHGNIDSMRQANLGLARFDAAKNIAGEIKKAGGSG